MPLVSILNELKRAQRERYAVPCFDTFDLFSTEGMFLAAAQKAAPTIIAIYDSALNRPNARAMAAYIRTRAKEAAQPISLMLDHGSSFEQCMKAIHYGFTDVMYDGSRLPLEENIATTKAIVRVAHAMGIGVEAELGHVGSGSEYRSYGAQRKGFTDPAAVEHFVQETGVDLLAVAIGTAHGLYDGDPQIDLELLRNIRRRVDIPLVLHGGTGCSEKQFRDVIEAGISKINVATDLFVTTGKRLVEIAKTAEAPRYFDLTSKAIESFTERCGYYLDLFGASGRV
ncbi:MAG: class II fructose-bisphosphate aldolase [Chloroflexi bacterium]|nr:class II fructose-bisphosphate aldolase [Chloroflexota bacterium]